MRIKTQYRLRGTSSSSLDGAAVIIIIIISSYVLFFLAASLVLRVTFHLWGITRAEGHPPRLNFFHLVLFFLRPAIPRPLLHFDIIFGPLSGGLAEYCGWLTCAEKEALRVCERDPSKAYIRRAVMYAGRKRRKPAQRS